MYVEAYVRVVYVGCTADGCYCTVSLTTLWMACAVSTVDHTLQLKLLLPQP
jgi:hypothetical protein